MTQEKQHKTRPSSTSDDVSPWALAGMGMQFFVAIIAFVYAGNWVDARLGTSPVFLFGGVFVGGGATFYLSYKRLTTRPRANDAPHDVTSEPPRDKTSGTTPP